MTLPLRDDIHSDTEYSPARGLRELFRERRLSIRTMDRPLRFATTVTIAGLIGAAVLIWLRATDAPRVSLGTIDDVQMTLSAPLFVAALALLSVGFGFLVAGSLFAGRVVAAVGLLCLTALIGWTTGILGIGGLTIVLASWGDWASRIVLGLIWVVAVLTLVLRRGRHGDAREDRRLRITVMAIVAALFGNYFVILWAASPVSNGLTLFPESVSLLMGNVAILATPMLMIAAIDFGEWGEFAAQRLAQVRLLQPGRPVARHPALRRLLLPVALCVVALGFGTFVVAGPPGERLWQIAQGIILLAIALAILLVAGRMLRVSRNAWPTTLHFAALFCVCATITLAGGVTVAALSGSFAIQPLPPVTSQGDYTSAANVHSVTGISGFTALVPVGWAVERDETDKIDRIRNTFPDGLTVVLIGLKEPAGTTADAFASALSLQTTSGAITDGTWQAVRVVPQGGGNGEIWMRTAHGAEQAFYGVARGPGSNSALAQLEAIVRTARPTGQPPATLASVLAENGGTHQDAVASQRHEDVIQSLGAGFAVVTALIALLLLAVFGRRWSSTWKLAVLFYGAAATITLVAAANSLGRVFLGSGASWPVMTIGGVLGAAGIFGLAALALASRSRAAWASRLPGALVGILGTAIVLGVIHQLYGLALDAAQVPQWAAILILVAVGWDIVMSGETLTNLSSTAFPRSSRVVVFYGYILVLAAAMVFYSGQLSAATGHRVTQSFFEPEAITQAALFRIGFPLLLLLFLLRVAAPQPRNGTAPVPRSTIAS